MLKHRIVTATVLILIVLSILFFAPLWLFNLLAAGLLLLGAWEWAQLAGIRRLSWQLSYIISMAAIFYIYLWLWQHVPSINAWLFSLLPLTWVACWLWIRRYPHIPRFTVYGLSLLGYWLLSGCWLSLVLIQRMGAVWLLFLLLLVWAADIGAYFVGRKWGRRKLMPAVSPNKTMEGFYAGGLCTIAIALTGLAWLPIHLQNSWMLLVIAVVISYFSLVGDLWESVLKRQRGVKDSGNLLPGHGGILDRIDSLLSTAPVFAGLFFFSGFLSVSLV